MPNCPFKIGETIYCLESQKDSAGPLYTKGKTYKVIAGYRYMGIIGDPIDVLPEGREFIPSWDKFVSLKEARKRKLKKLESV